MLYTLAHIVKIYQLWLMRTDALPVTIPERFVDRNIEFQCRYRSIMTNNRHTAKSKMTHVFLHTYFPQLKLWKKSVSTGACITFYVKDRVLRLSELCLAMCCSRQAI